MLFEIEANIYYRRRKSSPLTLSGTTLPRKSQKLETILQSLENFTSMCIARHACKDRCGSYVQNSVSAQDVAAETIQRRSKYFRPFPEIEHINNLNSIKKAYLLKNGNISSPLAIERVRMSDGKMVQRKLIVYNTCAFDSIVQVLLTSALDYKEYKDIIEKSTNETLQFVLQFMTDGPSTDVLKSRAAILKPLYSHTIKAALEVGGVTVIESLDAWGNVTTVWNQLMQSEPSAHTTQECSNASCPTIRTEKPFLTINHKAIAQYRFNLLEKAVQFNSYVKSTKCKNGDCSGRCTISQQLNNHLFIELDVRGDMSAKQGMRCQLKDLPDKVQLSQKDFRLTGVIAYETGHYMAYCRRLDGNWELYDDTKPSVKPVTFYTEIEPHAAVYIKSL